MKNRLILYALTVACALIPCRQVFAQGAPQASLVANVRDFGAMGDGKTDDTAALEKAWAFVRDTHKPLHREKFYSTVNATLYFPPGVYRYAGNGLSGDGSHCFQVKGDGVNSVRIEIEKDVYFITCVYVTSTNVEGISFNGGKGVFRCTWKGNMVGGKHIFHDCNFVDYSECAIGNNANDAPYLTVYDCIFHCRNGADAIGIAWGGDIADGQITRCDFEQDAYHVKLGDHLGDCFQVGPRNSFISYGGTKTKADIWIVPNLDGPVNSGQGSIIAENKFGNENVDPSKPRILIAAEDQASGADRLSRKPSEEICRKNESVTGIKLRDNLFAGGGAPRRGLVYSLVPNTALIFDHNQFAGSRYPYLIEFDSRIQRLPDNARANHTYVYSQENDGGQLCNLPGYAIALDPYSEFAGAGEAPDAWPQSDDPSYVPFVSIMGKDMSVIGKASVSPTSDPRGNMTAASVTLNDALSGLDIRFDNDQSVVEGRVAFIDVELVASKVNPLDHVNVVVLNDNAAKMSAGRITDEQRVFSREVKLQTYWQRVTIPFVIRDARDGDFHLAIRPLGWDSSEVVKGSKDSFECGNVRVYHAKSPVGLNHEGIKIVNDRDMTLSPGIDPEQIIYDGNLTAERTVKFCAPCASIRPLPGVKFLISRPAAGDALLRIERLATLAAGEWCEIAYTGERYLVIAKGKL